MNLRVKITKGLYNQGADTVTSMYQTDYFSSNSNGSRGKAVTNRRVETCYSKSGLQPAVTGTTWEFVRNAESWVPLLICLIGICIFNETLRCFLFSQLMSVSMICKVNEH